MGRNLTVMSGTQGAPLVDEICAELQIEPGKRRLGRFNDQEVDVQLLEDVRGRDVFIVNPTNAPSDNMIEMVLLARAAVMSSARRVTLVPTYLGYNRQDRKDRPRVPVSAKVFIDMLKISGAHRALLFDLHSEATASHFEPIITDHLYGSYVLVPHLKKLLDGHPFVVASPDAGGVTRARTYARLLGVKDLVIFSKSRSKPGEVDGEPIIIGDVKGKDVLLVDDMIDSGGTMIADAHAAKAAGAQRIFACATHAIFSKGVAAFTDELFSGIIVTNSIRHDAESLSGGAHVTLCSIAPLVAEAIRRVRNEESLSSLFLKK